MQQAIEIYKKVPNSRERRAELYQILRRYQQKSLSQMKSFDSPTMDISESVKLATSAVKGKTFQDALFHLAFLIVKPPNYQELKQHAEENIQKSFFRGMFGAVHVDRSGLVVAQVPSNLGIDNDECGKATWAEMLRSVQISHNLDVAGAIEPARREILFEHHLQEELFFTYLKNNPFVPQGHEYLYAKGLCAGLEGDFVTSAHILIPQLENSARHVLQQKGVETTSLNTHGLQEYMRVGAILEHPVFIETFGQDITFDLQALLIDRKYVNLRNEVSHGLLSTNLFFQPAVIYLWWITLRLCLMPLFGLWQNSLNVSEGSPDEDNHGSKYSNLKYC